MSPTDGLDLMNALATWRPTPHSRPLRICTRGQREYQWVWMLGGVTVPGTLETTEEVERLVRERKAVEV